MKLNKKETAAEGRVFILNSKEVGEQDRIGVPTAARMNAQGDLQL
ncbi:hypothetical protein ACPOL_3337 [Acidisarcina polymorpha]|uniref:Uncharacterized protein n=1 Tax=Acidisarcina polymorpha TaxID=2211140 RepID=A0A2Z5G0G7_9BACT|nr:hypothetical protein ACPOL_3337 [Acidisarcina polymorpha]